MATVGFAEAVAHAVREGHDFPAFPAGLSVDDGEAIQVEIAAHLGGAGGLKAGIGDAQVQRALGLDGPLLGYLYADRRLADGACIRADEAIRLECELGVRLDASGHIDALVPIVEIVRPRFANPADMSGPNLAACNVCADRYIAGSPISSALPPSGDVVLRRNGEQQLRERLASSLGGPRTAVDWMLEQAQRRSIQLWDDMLFITGTIGGAIPAAPGNYEVDFDGLGTLTFSVS